MMLLHGLELQKLGLQIHESWMLLHGQGLQGLQTH
jgi:hypothetical protein